MKSDKLDKAITEGKPFAFLSSLCAEFEESQTRKKIYDLNFYIDDDILPVYVDEYHSYDSSVDIYGYDPFVSIDRFMKLVRSADIVIVLFAKTTREFDHGSRIRLTQNFEYTSPASFWEMEIYQSSVWRKDIFFIAEKGFEPGHYLSQVLRLFKNILPTKVPTCSKEAIPEVVRYILKHKSYPNESALPGNIAIGKYLQQLDVFRVKYSNITKDELNLTSISSFTMDSLPDLDFVKVALLEHDKKGHYETKLTHLYLIYRELLKADYTNEKFVSFLPYWNEFCHKWFVSASWYGNFHGRVSLGIYPLLIDQKIIRERIRESKLDVFRKGDAEPPFGPIASELYSIYQFTQNKNELYRGLYELGQMKRIPYSVRGHIYLRLGRYSDAVTDFKARLKQVEKEAMSSNALAEAHSQLGIAYCRAYSLLKGLYHLHVGLNMFESDCGDKIRALRRLAKAYGALGWSQKSINYKNSAIEIANRIGAYDQIAKIELDR